MEQLALGRVDVLRPQRIVLAQLARLKADDAPAGVGEREHQAAREVVVRRAASCSPARAQLVAREAASRAPCRASAAARRRARAGTRAQTASPSPRSSRYCRAGRPGLPCPRGAARRTRVACSRTRVEPLAPLALLLLSAASSPRTRAGRGTARPSHSIAPAKSRFSRLADERDHVAALARSRSSGRACRPGSPRSSASAPRGTGSGRCSARPTRAAPCARTTTSTMSAAATTSRTDESLIRATCESSRAARRSRARSGRSCRR